MIFSGFARFCFYVCFNLFCFFDLRAGFSATVFHFVVMAGQRGVALQICYICFAVYLICIHIKNQEFLAHGIQPFCTTKASRGLHHSPKGQPAHLHQGGQTVF